MAQTPDRVPKVIQQRWLMVLRLVISFFLLISLVLIKIYGHVQDISLEWFEPGLTAVGLYSLLAVTYYILPGLGRASAFHISAQVMADLVLPICLTLITGGSDSPFSFLFIIAIINGSLMGGTRVALAVATFSAAIWGGLITIQDTGFPETWLLPGLKLSLPPIMAKRLASELSTRLVRILINTGACYLVAFLSGHLAGQLLISRRALVASQANFGRLADLNEHIIQSIDSGLITMDQSGIVITVNRAGLDIIGGEIQDIAGRPWQLFLPQLIHVLPSIWHNWATLSSTGGVRFEYVRQRDGRELTLELNVLALTGANDDLWGHLLVLKNLTSLIQMEAAVRKAEHLAAIGEMAAGLAHELRTPLTSMTGAWHLLSGTEPPEPEDHLRLIGIIGREMERLAKLTNDFLSFARPARANPRKLDFTVLVADQLNIFRHSKREGIRLEIRLNPVPPVFFDQDHFSQIIWNLLTNAVEAGEKQTELRIIVETDLDQDWADHVVFRIINDGPIIPKEYLPKLFDPFFSTKSSGNGLGLATVNRLLNEGGGHITVSSSHQPSNLRLTTFSAFFPRIDRLVELQKTIVK
ncbi:MAG: hypothetical protein AMR96_01840 [Candidatus Adiutrix intracellularis]|nr:MAG: hypothetical protein AMR96_01840 [Candidatus Adiutrix intracellularis]